MRLTNKRLEAVIEALTFRLAGEIDSGIPDKLYDEALYWALSRQSSVKTCGEITGRPSK